MLNTFVCSKSLPHTIFRACSVCPFLAIYLKGHCPKFWTHCYKQNRVCDSWKMLHCKEKSLQVETYWTVNKTNEGHRSTPCSPKAHADEEQDKSCAVCRLLSALQWHCCILVFTTITVLFGRASTGSAPLPGRRFFSISFSLILVLCGCSHTVQLFGESQI